MAIINQMKGNSTILSETLKNDIIKHSTEGDIYEIEQTYERLRQTRQNKKLTANEIRDKKQELDEAWKTIYNKSFIKQFVLQYSMKKDFSAVVLGNKPYNECNTGDEKVTGGCNTPPNDMEKNKKRSYLYVFTKIWYSISINNSDTVKAKNIFRKFIFDLFNTYVKQYNLEDDSGNIITDLNAKIKLVYTELKSLIGTLYLSNNAITTPIQMKDYDVPLMAYNYNLFDMLQINEGDISKFVNSMPLVFDAKNPPRPDYSFPTDYPTLKEIQMPEQQLALKKPEQPLKKRPLKK